MASSAFFMTYKRISIYLTCGFNGQSYYVPLCMDQMLPLTILDVCSEAQRVRLSLLRGFVYRHDYKAMLNSIIIKHVCAINNSTHWSSWPMDSLKLNPEFSLRQFTLPIAKDIIFKITRSLDDIVRQMEINIICSALHLFLPVIFIGIAVRSYHSELLEEVLPIFDMYGGAPTAITAFDYYQLENYLAIPPSILNPSSVMYRFSEFLDCSENTQKDVVPHLLYTDIPFSVLYPMLNFNPLRKLARAHKIKIAQNLSLLQIRDLCTAHNCTNVCKNYRSVFAPLEKVRLKTDMFPPEPPKPDLIERIISGWVQEFLPVNIEEAGCAVCGQLKKLSDLNPLKTISGFLHVLNVPGVSRIERKAVNEKISEINGPVIDDSCDKVCSDCRRSLLNGKVPRIALARGLWLGKIPSELEDLNFVERLLIQKIRTNCCFVRVSSGMRKMISHVIAFDSPVVKVYDTLPPPPEDLDDVLAIMFTGPCKPTEKDFQRTPMLVRRKYVYNALTWLKLNHPEYHDLNISMANLNKYPEDTPPVSVEYKESTTDGNRQPEGTSVHDNEPEIGTEQGEVPFVVHGITGESLQNETVESQKAKALAHLNSQGKFLAIGHSKDSSTIFKNPKLYPSIFPWLFPYGLGGFGMNDISQFGEKSHKKFLLNYHDKRFETDITFPFVAFSHEQIKATTHNGFAMTELQNFPAVAERILNVNFAVLTSIIQRLERGEIVRPETEDEKLCYSIIQDLDHVGGGVKGSMTSKKYLRNELWSLISYLGAPSWYITFAPSDTTHPLCIYYAGKDEKFQPNLNLPDDERVRQVIRNPVSGAKFFDFMVKMFIKHILGVDSEQGGLFGRPSAYYGTVEQQGRLTLHLHMLLWIASSKSPQEIRDAILDPNSEFQKKIVQYLEGVHTGNFMNGSQEDVEEKVRVRSESEDYVNPVYTLPTEPPANVKHTCDEPEFCDMCSSSISWWNNYQEEVDDIISRTHIHKCKSTVGKDGKRKKNKDYFGCLDNKYGTCSARFPRQIVEQTQVDQETGYLRMQKAEPWINTYNPTMTYLLRCNSDVTSLLSGTAIKAVVFYVSNYITKWSLNTHVIFDVIRTVLVRNSEMLGGPLSRQEKVRKLVTQMVNLLSVKMELGAPMICMYLLDNPDHYTSHRFKAFYWKNFVNEVERYWNVSENKEPPQKDKVLILRKRNGVVASSQVYDYIYRPAHLEGMCLYDWIQLCERVKVSNSKEGSATQENVVNQYDDTDSEVESVTSDSDSDSDFESDIEDNLSEEEYTQPPKPVQKKLPKNTFPFLTGHPLADSHALKVSSDDRRLVPNFIGGSLPRADKGNREYYCTVMLTLFKPWRSGESLKNVDENWDHAFENFSFSNHQQQVLKNFQVKYECLDSRDDYNAQRKAMGSTLDDNYCPEYDDGIDCDLLEKIADPLLNGEPGPQERRRQEQMNEMKDILAGTGWSDILHDRKSHIPERCHPEIDRSAHNWKLQINKMRQNILDKRHKSSSNTDSAASGRFKNAFPDQVAVLDKDAFEQKTRQGQTQSLIDRIANEFKFQDNPEQDRAFRIIANHAVSPCPQQLKMYIGGMGGTGKSTVLRALRRFFEERSESHRMIVLAPTGNAAALLAGSTYHYMFGINSKSESEFQTSSISQICSRLEGVNYIFLDEVSMLSCKDMYKISVKLATALNLPHLPFGGMNMIFAGDFSQLPPAIGNENVALYSHSIGTSPKSKSDQESSIGQHLWHQVTTVVMLRKNMRQTNVSERDNMYRKALENMRYKSCTHDDISLLRSMISNPQDSVRSLKNENFRNVPIILTYNKHKDVVNKLGAERFAAETGQKLTSFYSEDEQVVLEDTPEHERQFRKRRRSKKFKVNKKIQNELWNQPHSYNDRQIPGRLDLCLGMPVMLRFNSATELCITKGQEGHVHGWKEKIGKNGKPVLDVLFVKLHDPPKPPSPIQFDGLPENVVPITRNSVRIVCKLSDDSEIVISRTQVEVLPNFAMTDFASQGKTRDWNVVDINNSRDFRAIYTALSRSSCANQTLILQGFNTSLLTGGIRNKGGYRQELRELEILDEITRLKYLGELPVSVLGDRRSTLIKSFRDLHGQEFQPPHMHSSIQWSNDDPILETRDSGETWRILVDSKETQQAAKKSEPKGRFQTARGAAEKLLSHSNLKRKRSLAQMQEISPVKRIKDNNDSQPSSTPPSPSSFLNWYNNSCAYDCVIMLLNYLYSNYALQFESEQSHFSQVPFTELAETFQSNITDLAPSREQLRHSLHQINQEAFRYGMYTDAREILYYLTQSDLAFLRRKVACLNGHIHKPWKSKTNMLLRSAARTYTSTQIWVNNYVEPFYFKCQVCYSDLQTVHEFVRLPGFFMMSIPGETTMQLDKSLTLTVGQEQKTYNLRAIIYFGDSHYILRLIHTQGDWIYDGIKNGLSQPASSEWIEDPSMNYFQHKKAAAVLYVSSA